MKTGSDFKKLDFLIGEWDLEYDVPESSFSKQATGYGHGIVKRILDDKYVVFDYSSTVGGKQGSAHGIFAWDERENITRYWWFESSGNFLTATCQFTDNDTLFLNWHDTLIRQTFERIDSDRILLLMEVPVSKTENQTILRVNFTRKTHT